MIILPGWRPICTRRPPNGQELANLDTPLPGGHNVYMDRHVFARLVKEALVHLYDQAYLQCHPLAELLVADPAQELGGMTLHRVLLEAIEALRPSPRVPPSAPIWRPYLALYLRYVENMTTDQVAQELAISPRQLRREQAKGLEALTELLWDRHRRLQEQSKGVEAEEPSSLLDEEVARLSSARSDHFTSVDATVRSVLATLRELATRRHVSLAIALSPGVPPTSIDRVVLRQALLNVLTYILDRCTHGAIELTSLVADRWVELSIQYKSGQEIASPAAMVKEDDRFLVASRLIGMQGGRMELKADDGLTVRLFLPARHPPTVLVIDDNPDVIQLFQRYLGGGAYHVVGATSSEEALRLARELRPYAITLDVMMPTQDGWELLQNLKNHPVTKDIPVIVCSVLRERELALSLGAADFLAKPVTQQMLLMALGRCGSKQGNVERPDLP